MFSFHWTGVAGLGSGSSHRVTHWRLVVAVYFVCFNDVKREARIGSNQTPYEISLLRARDLLARVNSVVNRRTRRQRDALLRDERATFPLASRRIISGLDDRQNVPRRQEATGPAD